MDWFYSVLFIYDEYVKSTSIAAGFIRLHGQIHPNMSTMLAFIVTEIAIGPVLLRKTVKEMVDGSFNMIISAAGNAGLPFDYLS